MAIRSRPQGSSRLRKIQQASLRDQIVSAIRDAVIQGRFRSGEKIPEQDLADELGVSRTPIREAIRILELQGLVESRPKNGTYIATLHRAEIQDSLLVRVSLEELAVRQALERMDEQEWSALCGRLEHLLHGIHEAVRRDDAIAAIELDMQWHTSLIDAAGNRYLSRLWYNAGFAFLTWSPDRERYPLAFDQWGVVFHARHRELLDALRGRDPGRCCEAIRIHIMRKLFDIDAQHSAAQRVHGAARRSRDRNASRRGGDGVVRRGRRN